MPITVEQIAGLYYDRVKTLGPLHNQMRKLRAHVNGEEIIPLSEMDLAALPNVASLVNQGLEQMSTRIASVNPMPYFPPMREGNDRSIKLAHNRKKAMLGIWDDNRMSMKMRRRARHLLAYSNSPVYIKPDFKNLTPRWYVRNPLDTFPSPVDDPDNPIPDDCIFTYQKTAGWLMSTYGGLVQGRLDMGKVSRDTMFTLLEYVSADEIVICVLGKENNEQEGYNYGGRVVELERIVNRCGHPLVVVPQRITLDKPTGQFDGMLGAYFTRARLQALTEIAIERGIFPERYLISRPGENPEIIQVADPKIGQLGVVKGGDIRDYQIAPGYKTDIAMDRLERQERLEGGIPAEFGGESGTNIRTGRRGENVLAATVDFRVQEAQAIFESSLLEENKIAIRMEKTYWGDAPKSFFIGAGKAMETYTPNKLWETEKHYVSYPAAGSDVNALIVGLGQRLGTGLMSKESAREADPLIGDPELERDRIVAESLESAMLASIQALAADPNGPYQPNDLAFIASQVRSNKLELADAIMEAQRRAQERQAAQAPPESPDAMPGLSMPGQGMEAGMGAPAGPPSLDSLLGSLGGGGGAAVTAMPESPGGVLSLANRLGA